MLVLHTGATEQPPVGTGVDWTNPVTQGLVVATNGSVAIDLASKSLVTPVSNGLNPVQAGNLLGRSGDITGTFFANAVDVYTVPRAVGGLITVLAVILHNMNRGNSPWVLNRYNTNTAATSHWAITINGSNFPMMYAVNTAGTGFSATHQTATSATKPAVLVGTVDAANTVKIWHNGIVCTTPGTLTGTSNVAAPAGSFPDVYAVGSRSPVFSSNSLACGPVFMTAMWDRTLTDAEVVSVSANPWQLFE